MSNKFPWKDPTSVYADSGPQEATIFAIEGVSFTVVPTGKKGCDTGRKRYRVTCGACDCILHEATTGPSSQVKWHMVEDHGMSRDQTIGYR
jgi:hypothetical protein